VASNLELLDKVIVKGNKASLQIVEVRQIDEVCDVDVDAEYTYGWVFQKVAMENYYNNIEVTEKVVKQLKAKQREQVRKQALERLGIDSTLSLLSTQK
jgi:hypothetical protein